MVISGVTQRRYILGKQGLWPGRRWQGQVGLAQALRAVESVQIDPVSIVAPSYDIVLWGRVAEYVPTDLHTLMYEARQFFDYGGGLMILSMTELPCWRVHMARRRQEKRWATFAAENPELLAQVRDTVRRDGPLRNRDLKGKAVQNYRGRKDTAVALYYLWLTGELMTHHRHGKERVHDFLENVAPIEHQWVASAPEAEAFFARKSISRLGLITARFFRAAWQGYVQRHVDKGEAEAKLAAMVAAGEVAMVQVEGQKKPFYYLAEDTPMLRLLEQGGVPDAWQPIATTTTDAVVFLSPLEYVSARGRAKKLFDFEYIWEIYKPAEKRRWGAYTMPILYGDRLVARLDAKLDRTTATLHINGFWTEAWFEVDEAFKGALSRGLGEFAEFLGAEVGETAVLPF